MSRSLALIAILGLLAGGCRAPAAPPSDETTPLSEETTPPKGDGTAERLRAHVRQLSETIGPRCGVTMPTYVKLEAAFLYVQSHFELILGAATDRSLVAQRYEEAGKTYSNVAIEMAGSNAHEIVVVGAHYDSFCAGGEPYTPGADDDASGVAVLLELARRFDQRLRALPRPPPRSLRFVAFTNEEPPYFQNAAMGSQVYAQQCQRRGVNVHAMLSLEMLGYFSDEAGSQRYPYGIDRIASSLPTRGNFLAFLGNFGSRQLVLDAVEAFRHGTRLPAEGMAAPFLAQFGWSDNWSFWQSGYPAAMVTDTAMQRNPNYHLASDTWETLDYRRMAMAVDGLTAVIAQLIGE